MGATSRFMGVPVSGQIGSAILLLLKRQEQTLKESKTNESHFKNNCRIVATPASMIPAKTSRV